MGKRSKCRGDIPVQLPDMGPEFAGKQYEAMFNDCCNSYTHSHKFFIFRDILKKLIFSNYIWYGVNEDEARAIEWALITEGRVIALKSQFSLDDQTPEGVFYGRYISNPFIDTQDFYGNPIAAGVLGLNGKELYASKQDDFVIGYPTSAIERYFQLTHPIITYIDILARELDDAYSAWKVAVETRKCGMVFNCKDKRTKNFLERILSDVSENKPYIILTGQDFEESTEVLFNNGANSQIVDFHQNFMNVVSFVMDMLGIENSPQNKKERLVVSEAEMSRSLSRYLGADGLKARRAFAEECNKKLGTNLRVENYLASVIDEMMDDATREGIQKDGEENVLAESSMD